MTTTAMPFAHWLLIVAALAPTLVASSEAFAGRPEGPLRPGELAASAETETARFALVVGSNETTSKDQKPLRFADDDAARMAELQLELGAEVELLTVFDQSSQARFPDLVGEAQQPTKAHLDAAWARLRRSMEAAADAGRPVELTIYYAGHGDVGPDGQGFLTLAAGDTMSRADLFTAIIGTSPADHNHVIIDACRSEQFVLSRGEWQPDRGPASYNDSVREYLDGNHLSAHPNTGVVLAHSVDQQTHEWERWQGGVFTHELLSGLRGGADLNGDGMVEYSELGAFVSAANSGIGDPRARLEVAVHPPRGNERAPLVHHEAIERQRVLLLAGAAAGRYSVEDARGVRLADLHHASGQPAYLRLPDGPIYVFRHDDDGARVGEARLPASSRGIVDLVALEFGEPQSEARGPLDDALRAGLFKVEYGRGYYTGYTDHEHLLAVADPDWEVQIWQRDPETGEMVPVAHLEGEGEAPSVDADDGDADEVAVTITSVEVEDHCDWCWDRSWLSFGAAMEFNPFSPSGKIGHPEDRVIANQAKGFDDEGFPAALRGIDVRIGTFGARTPTDFPWVEGYFRTGYTEGHMTFMPIPSEDPDAAGQFGVGHATHLDYMSVPLFFGGNFYFPDWPVRPYVGMGVGIDILRVDYRRHMQENAIAVGPRIGFELHGGIDARLTNYVILFGEVRQLWSRKMRLAGVPDFSNTGLTVSAGIRFGIPVGRGASADGRPVGGGGGRTIHVVETKKKQARPAPAAMPPAPVPAPAAAPSPAAAPAPQPEPSAAPQPEPRPELEPAPQPEPIVAPEPAPRPEPSVQPEPSPGDEAIPVAPN